METKSIRSILCIGAANVDHKYHALGPVVMRTSNPVTSTTCYGGVARNVAENLARLGNPVQLLSFVGCEAQADKMLAYTQETGVDIQLVQKFSDQVTGQYIAFLNQEGEQVVGLADMGIYDAITWDSVKKTINDFPNNGLIFSDTCFTKGFLKRLIQQCAKEERLLAMDLVSVSKAMKLPNDLTGIYLLVGNRDEIAALSQVDIKSSRDYTKACFSLLQRGAKYVVMTLGEEGLFYVSSEEQVYFPAKEVGVVDVIGVGDSLSAGMIHALVRGLTPFQAIPYGISAALINLVSPDTVSQKMDVELIDQMVLDINFLGD